MFKETFNLSQFEQQHQEVQLTPDQQAKLDELKKELQILIDGELSEKTDEQFKEIVRRIIEVYDEHKEGLTSETIQRSQKMLDFVFGEKRFDLQAEYEQGNILGFSKEQLEAIEKLPEKEKYSEIIIIPGQIPREEIIQAVNQKYKEKYSREIEWSNNTRDDHNRTEAAKRNPRPQGFYAIALRPQKETIEAHPETELKSFNVQLEILRKNQEQNPQLNLRGMTLPEAMLFDVYTLANSKNEDEHADSSHFRIEWSYNRCLEEIVHDADGNPEYVLGVNWIFDHPHLYVSWGNRYIDGVAARFISLPLEK